MMLFISFVRLLSHRHTYRDMSYLIIYHRLMFGPTLTIVVGNHPGHFSRIRLGLGHSYRRRISHGSHGCGWHHKGRHHLSALKSTLVVHRATKDESAEMLLRCNDLTCNELKILRRQIGPTPFFICWVSFCLNMFIFSFCFGLNLFYNRLNSRKDSISVLKKHLPWYKRWLLNESWKMKLQFTSWKTSDFFN